MRWEHRDYVWYVRHEKKKFLVGPSFSYPPQRGAPPLKKIPPGIKKISSPPPPLTPPPDLSHPSPLCLMPLYHPAP